MRISRRLGLYKKMPTDPRGSGQIVFA